MDIFSKYPLKSLNTFGIDVFAKEFIEVHTDEELLQIVEKQKIESKQLLFLGGGSNILFTGDYHGTVIKISTRGIEILSEDEENVILRVAAGEDWDGLVEYCVNRGWGGLENLSGIPGQVGSSPIQNIGAYGTEMKDHFEALEGISLCTGEIFNYDAERCQFGYRNSIFKRALKGRVIITHVLFRLKKEPLFNLSYLALKQKLESYPAEEISLKRIRQSILEIRSSKLPDPKIIGNAGSFFKNPEIEADTWLRLSQLHPNMPHFPQPDGRVKVPAGWLIEQCGWKGFREGDAGCYDKQALVLVNYGQATGLEILALARRIAASVRERFGIEIEPEVNVW